MEAAGWSRGEVKGGGALWFVAAALLCAMVAAYTAVAMVRSARRVVPVVVALRGVPPLTRVAAADVAVEDVPFSALPAGAVRAPEAAVGRVTRMGLVPGEVVTAESISAGVAPATAFDARLAAMAGIGACAAGGAGTSAAPRVGAAQSAGPAPTARCRDLVAVSLPLDANRGYLLVRAGDVVDVAATYTLQSGTVSQVVAADVPVLFKADDASGPGGPAPAGSPLGAVSGWLVLGVTPRQALRVQLAETAGRVSVFLRPLGAPPESPALRQEVVTTADLAGAGGASQVPPAVAGQLP